MPPPDPNDTTASGHLSQEPTQDGQDHVLTTSAPGFSTILAATIHDMKNAISLVLYSLDDYIQEQENLQSQERLGHLQYEARRINNKLIQLLVFYKMEQTKLCAHIDEHNVYDNLVELLLQEQSELKIRHISAEVVCDENLMWYFDRELISGLLGNALHNAIRHTDGRLLISATVSDEQLQIQINDDGDGFSSVILDSRAPSGHGVSFSHGNTGLGLYFCSLIAGLHKRNERAGYVNIDNGGPLGGGCFSLTLP